MKKIRTKQYFNGKEILNVASVLVLDNQKIIDIITDNDAGEEVLEIDGLLCPAFVNAHCHLELSHLKNIIPQHIGMSNFLQQIVSQRNHFSEEEIFKQIEFQDEKMYQAGISLVGDISNIGDTIGVKKKSKIEYHTFVEILGLFPHMVEQKYKEGLALKDSFLKENLKATLVPHAPYSLCMDLFKKIGNTQSNDIVSMHYHESKDEIDWLSSHDGEMKKFYDFLNFSITSDMILNRNEWAKVFRKNCNFIVVHNVFATIEDIEFLQQEFTQYNTQLFFCLCPQANQYIQEKRPPYFLWEKYSDRVCIGTDSLASNIALDILSEIKLLQQSYPQITLSYLLQAATYNGAKALRQEEQFGSIAIGKSDQLIVLENINNDNLENASVKRIETFF